MKLHELKPRPGSTQKEVRVGRGIGSGIGRTAGRGGKGQTARSGGKGGRRGFEGGQMPMQRRLPKVGFTNIHAIPVEVLTTASLNCFKNGDQVGMAELKAVRLVSKNCTAVKVILKGNIERKINLKVTKVSKGAAEAIKAAGGSVELA